MTVIRSILAVFLGFAAVCGGDAVAHTQTEGTALAPQGQAGVVADPDALLRLGDLYYDGKAVDADMAKAFAYYTQAAYAGSQTGKIRMGEMLALGQGTKQETELGRALVHEVAEMGNPDALLTLGELYTGGDAGPMSSAKAIRAFEEAASKGNAKALVRLGDLYLHGRFQPPRGVKALNYYRRAAEAGNPYGLFGIGNIYIGRLAGRAGTLAEGIKLLRQAESGGVAGAVVAISNSYFYGKRPRPKRALATLEQAMQEGNLEAALELISVYRDGKRDGRVVLVKRDPALARKYLEKIEMKLTPSQRAFESYLLDSAAASAPSYRKLYNRLQELSVRDRSKFIRELRTINPRVYVYFVQTRLKELQFFGGKATGKLSAKTSRAMRRYCDRSGTRYFCSKGPMSSQRAEILSYAFQ